MYFDDHGPPHFHVRAAGHSAKVQIDTLEVLVSDLPRASLASCSPGPRYTPQNLRRAGDGPVKVKTLNEIEPLR
jgi:hypothetical protein